MRESTFRTKRHFLNLKRMGIIGRQLNFILPPASTLSFQPKTTHRICTTICGGDGGISRVAGFSLASIIQFCPPLKGNSFDTIGFDAYFWCRRWRIWDDHHTVFSAHRMRCASGFRWSTGCAGGSGFGSGNGTVSQRTYATINAHFLNNTPLILVCTQQLMYIIEFPIAS